MTQRSSTAGRRLEQELLEYLARHPQGCDTVEGIAHWWLLEQRVRRGLTEVKGALARLEAAGRVRSRRQADGQVCYWPVPLRMTEIPGQAREAPQTTRGLKGSDPGLQGRARSTP